MSGMTSAAAAQVDTFSPDGTPREVFKASGARTTILSFVFLLLLPFYVSLPAMMWMRVKNGLWDDAAGLVQVLHDLRPQAHYLGAREMHDILERMGSEARSRGASACTSRALELRAVCQAVERSLRTSFRPA